MPKETDPRKAESLRAFIAPDLDQLTRIGQRSVASMMHLHGRALRDALRFNAELLDFARRRIGTDIETSDRLCRCESVTEAMEAMSDYYQAALRDYAEVTSTLVGLGNSIASENAEETIAEVSQLSEARPA